MQAKSLGFLRIPSHCHKKPHKVRDSIALGGHNCAKMAKRRCEPGCGARMTEVIEFLGLTQTAFARSIGVAEATVSEWANEKRCPARGSIGLICDAFSFPRGPLTAFIEKGGDWPFESVNGFTKSGGQAGAYTKGRPFGYMPRYTSGVPAAWDAETVAGVDDQHDADQWVPNLSGYADAFSMPVMGDSMESVKYQHGGLPEGCEIICSPGAPIKDGDRAYIRFSADKNNENVVRQVFALNGGKQWRLHPLNDKYQDRVVDADDMRMARVVAIQFQF